MCEIVSVFHAFINYSFFQQTLLEALTVATVGKSCVTILLSIKYLGLKFNIIGCYIKNMAQSEDC